MRIGVALGLGAMAESDVPAAALGVTDSTTWVLYAGVIPNSAYPNLYPNPPQHHPTQTYTPRGGFLRKSASLGHPPTSTDTRTPIGLLRAESGLRDGPGPPGP